MFGYVTINPTELGKKAVRVIRPTIAGCAVRSTNAMAIWGALR